MRWGIPPKPVAWPKARCGYADDPSFHLKRSTATTVELSEVALRSLSSAINGEFVDSLRMYCADQPILAEGYLRRAEYLYRTYGTDEVFQLAGDTYLLSRGETGLLMVWVQLALQSNWEPCRLLAAVEERADLGKATGHTIVLICGIRGKTGRVMVEEVALYGKPEASVTTACSSGGN